MAGQSKNTKQTTIRLTTKQLAIIDTYAAGNNLSRAQAVSYFIDQGIKVENTADPMTQQDYQELKEVLRQGFTSMNEAILNQPIIAQPLLPPVESARLPLLKRLLKGRGEER